MLARTVEVGGGASLYRGGLSNPRIDGFDLSVWEHDLPFCRQHRRRTITAAPTRRVIHPRPRACTRSTSPLRQRRSKS